MKTINFLSILLTLILAPFARASTLPLGPFPIDTPTELFDTPLPAEPSIDPQQTVYIDCDVYAEFITWNTLGGMGGSGSVDYKFNVPSVFFHISAGVIVTHVEAEVVIVQLFGTPLQILTWHHSGTIGVTNPTLNAQLRDGTSIMPYIFIDPAITGKESNATGLLIGGNVTAEITIGNTITRDAGKLYEAVKAASNGDPLTQTQSVAIGDACDAIVAALAD